MNLNNILCALLSGALIFISPGLGCYQALAAETSAEAGGAEPLGPDNFAVGSGNSQEQSPAWETPGPADAVNHPEDLSLPSFETEGEDSKNLAGPGQDPETAQHPSQASGAGESPAEIGGDTSSASSSKLDQQPILKTSTDKLARSEAFRQAAVWLSSGKIIFTRIPLDSKSTNRPPLLLGRSEQEDLNKRLMEAADNLDLAKVKDLYAQGADLNANNGAALWVTVSQNLFALTEAEAKAIKDKSFEIAKFLLEHGANANIPMPGQSGWTALMMADYWSNVEMARLLLDYRADPNARSANHDTVLTLAASGSSAEIVRLLLDRGAQVNTTDHHGWTALCWAAAQGRQGDQKVRLLIERGANKTLALFIRAVVPNSYFDIGMAWIIASSSLKRSISGLDAVKLAILFVIAAGSLAAAHLIFHSGVHAAGPAISLAAVTPVLTNSGQNPELNKELLSAAAKGDTQKVGALLSQGADVNARDDSFGLTPLMRAVRGGHFETARLIARRAAASRDGWAAADEKDNSGRTALMHAANAGRLDMVKFLVEECGVDIHATDSEGRTVMDYAPVSDDPGIAQYLAQGPRAGTSSSGTGLDIAVKFLRNAFFMALWCVILKLLLR